MSGKHSHTLISVREFVHSWGKEIYELTNLDLFIYQVINHLGQQLENRFFAQHGRRSRLYLTTEQLGSLCFNLGDGLEYFLEERYYGHSRSKGRIEINRLASSFDPEEENFTAFPKSLPPYLPGNIIHEENFRVQLMELVVLDTLQYFYFEEMGIELNNYDIELFELGDFIVEEIIHFIRHEGQSLLAHPTDPAIEYFEELLDSEEAESENSSWELDGSVWPEDEEAWAEWETPFEDVTLVIQRFVQESPDRNPDDCCCLAHDMELFEEYLIEHAQVHNLYQIEGEHFLEFFAIWLVQKLAQEDESQFTRISQSLARFVSWLKQQQYVDLKRPFLRAYERVKIEVPRVVKALNIYLGEYNLFEVLLTRGNNEDHQISGFYQIQRLSSRFQKTMDLVDVQAFSSLENVRFPSSAYAKLKVGDILQVTLIEKNYRWEVLEIQYIYPDVARPFLF
ncbi:MAG: hypothetical protein D6681_08450 [Calditrichaeota bacterium]|nr:MAG: hypothetical protein D6681_08450 [Calditrichota bacterium]